MNSFLLELDGKPAARLLSVDSLGFKTESLANRQPPGLFSPPKIEPRLIPSDIKVTFGADASHALLDWVSGSVGLRKTGAIIILDARSVVLSRIEFTDAIVTSFLLPAVDRSSRAAAHFSASFRPDRILKQAGGNRLTGPSVMPAAKQWNSSNFRFNIGGLPAEGEAVTKVSGFGLKHNIMEFYSGKDRNPKLIPTKNVCSSLVVTLPTLKASGVLQWADESVRERSASAKDATLEYLGPGNGARYFAVGFTGLEVVMTRVSKPSGSSHGEEVAAELVYDSVKLSYF